MTCSVDRKGLTPLVSANDAPPLLWRISYTKHLRHDRNHALVSGHQRSGAPGGDIRMQDISTAQLLKNLVFTINSDQGEESVAGYGHSKSFFTNFADSLPSAVYFACKDGDSQRDCGQTVVVLNARRAIKDGHLSLVRAGDVLAAHYHAADKLWQESDPIGHQTGLFHTYSMGRRSNWMHEYNAFGTISQVYYVDFDWHDLMARLARNGLFEPNWEKMREDGTLSKAKPYQFYNRGNLRDKLWQFAIKQNYAQNAEKALEDLALHFTGAVWNGTGLDLGSRWAHLFFEYVKMEVKIARSAESNLWFRLNDVDGLIVAHFDNTFVANPMNDHQVLTKLCVENDWFHETEIRSFEVTVFHPLVGRQVSCEIEVKDAADKVYYSQRYDGFSNEWMFHTDAKRFKMPRHPIIEAIVDRHEDFVHRFTINLVHSPKHEAACGCTPRVPKLTQS